MMIHQGKPAPVPEPVDLVETQNNPAPLAGKVQYIKTIDSVLLRTARWDSGTDVSGTLVICPGRGEFIEKYFEVIFDLLERDFNVVILDWRGQGLSQRLTRNRRKGHVRDFSDYLLDLEALRREVLEPSCPRPWFALGHSMGGAILLDEARSGKSMFERMVLSAPMIDLYRLRMPKLARAFAKTLSNLGLGYIFVPGGGATSVLTRPFDGNVLTSDRRRYTNVVEVVEEEPDLAIGDPTISWVNSAFRVMDELRDPNVQRGIRTPVLLIAAGSDRVVDTVGSERLAAGLKVGHCIVIPESRHEILIERDLFRNQFWAAFDAFLPGER